MSHFTTRVELHDAKVFGDYEVLHKEMVKKKCITCHRQNIITVRMFQ